MRYSSAGDERQWTTEVSTWVVLIESFKLMELTADVLKTFYNKTQSSGAYICIEICFPFSVPPRYEIPGMLWNRQTSEFDSEATCCILFVVFFFFVVFVLSGLWACA